MGGEEYDRGQIEAQGASINRVQDVLAKLIFVLTSKGMLTKKEAVDIVAEYSDITGKDL